MLWSYNVWFFHNGVVKVWLLFRLAHLCKQNTGTDTHTHTQTHTHTHTLTLYCRGSPVLDVSQQGYRGRKTLEVPLTSVAVDWSDIQWISSTACHPWPAWGRLNRNPKGPQPRGLCYVAYLLWPITIVIGRQLEFSHIVSNAAIFDKSEFQNVFVTLEVWPFPVFTRHSLYRQNYDFTNN